MGSVRTIFFALAIIALIFFAAHFYYNNVLKKTGPFAIPLNERTHYLNARSAEGAGDFLTAVAEYKAALQEPLDPSQETIILYHLAAIQSRTDPKGAIAALKNIFLQDTRYSRNERMRALIQMVSIYRRHSREEIAEFIFSDEPYRSFYVQGNISQSIINLLEYAHETWPHAVTEAMLAREYAREWSREAQTKGNTPELTDFYLDLIKNKLNLTSDLLVNWVEDRGLSEIYALRAETYALVQKISGKTIGDYRAEYERALQASIDEGIYTDGFIRWRYARSVLVNGASSDAQKIRDILLPITSSEPNDSSYPEVKEFFRSIRTSVRNNPEDDFSMSLFSIALVDPNFKTMLLNLGWSEADFPSKVKKTDNLDIS